MTFEQLYYFVEVYQQKNLTTASSNLCISRQSLSASIKRLEEELGTVFFIRSNTGIKSTENGRIFYQYAYEMLYNTYKMKLAIQNENNSVAGVYKIGLCNYIMEYYADTLYGILCQTHPEYSFDFYLLNPDIPLYHQTDYDISFTILNAKNNDLINDLAREKKKVDVSLELKYMRSFKIHVWLNKDSPFTKCKEIPFEKLQSTNFCTFKNFINTSKLKGYSFLRNYKLKTEPITVHIKEKFVDYIENRGYTTIDIPFLNNKFAFEDFFEERNVAICPTDVEVALIAVHKKNIDHYLFQHLADLLILSDNRCSHLN